MQSLLALSQPKRWFLLAVPFLLGVAAGGPFFTSRSAYLVVGAHLLYFLFPANLWLRLGSLSKHPRHSSHWLLATTLLWLALTLTSRTWEPLLCAVGFLALSWAVTYQKGRFFRQPFLDLSYGVVFVIPGFFGYTLVANQWPLHLPSLGALLLWTLATTAFSSLGLLGRKEATARTNTAERLGLTGTLWFCLVLYALATWLGYPLLGSRAFLIGGVYAALVLLGLFIGRPTWYDRRGLTPQERIRDLTKLLPFFHILISLNLFLTFLSWYLGS